MTQHQIAHQVTLPPCADGHTARHVLDHRCANAGGGHFLECECRRTIKHASVEMALAEWIDINRKRRTRTRKHVTPAAETAASADVLQFALFQRSANS